MSALPKHVMTVDEFLAWDARQPKEAGRFELIDGIVVAQQSERVVHVEVETALCDALRAAIKSRRLPCFAMGDGLTVRVAAKKIYKPDGLVYCGKRLDLQAIEATDPVIIVEVLSDDSVDRDHGEKLPGYFSLPSVQHYLIADPKRRVIVHHRRASGEDLLTRVCQSGQISLDPPGIEIDVAGVFER
jgi:Uma2 family endonuclease